MRGSCTAVKGLSVLFYFPNEFCEVVEDQRGFFSFISILFNFVL